MHLIICYYHVIYEFKRESTFYICLNVKELFVWNRRDIWSLSDCNGTRTENHLFFKPKLNHLAKLTKWLSWFWKVICTVHLTLCYYHGPYAFQSKSKLYICLDVKELLARNRRDILSLSDCNRTRTHNHLVRKRTLNHLAKLAKWLICVVSTYSYGTFDCIFN